MEHQFHRELKHSVLQFMHDNLYDCREEFQLPNKKIADLACVNKENRVLIIEVKTTLSKCSLAAIYDKYGSYCHGLYVAGDVYDIEQMLTPDQFLDWQPMTHKVGLLGVCRHQVSIRRQATPTILPVDRAHGLAFAIRGGTAIW